MKRLISTLAVASVLGLTGCNEENSSNNPDESSSAVNVSRIKFSPSSGAIPLPNDLLFANTPDGTLQMPGEENGNYLDPKIALGALDGWSTTMPITINLDLAPGTEPDPASAVGAVRLFEVALGGPLSPDPDCTNAVAASICKVKSELQHGTDFKLQTSKDTIAIVPLKPLKPTTGYAYVTTEGLRDLNGKPILRSFSWNFLRLDTEGFTAQQLAVKTLLDNYLNKLDSRVAKESVTFAGVFSTQSIQNSVTALTQLMADGLQPKPSRPVSPLFAPKWTQPPTPLGITVAQALRLTPAMGQTYALADAVDLYAGELELPYFLTIPTPTNPTINSRWKALGDSPLAVLQQVKAGAISAESFAAQAIAQGIDPQAAQTAPNLLVGASFKLDNGDMADTQRHITRFNPIPNPCGGVSLSLCQTGGQKRVTVPVQITIPNPTKLAALGITIEKPATGWPVAMTLHGLGGNKNTTLPLASAYASSGIATVSIDMPLHGERGFDLDSDDVYDFSATSPTLGSPYKNGNPLAFVKIDSSLTNRDNFRQAIVDQLALRLSLTALTQGEVAAQQAAGMPVSPTFDMAKVSLQGLSLGAITGTTVTAYANSWPTENGPNPYAFTSASLVAPSGGLGGSFAGSATFGPVLIKTLVTQQAPNCVNEGAIVQTATCATVVEKIKTEVIPSFGFAVQTAIEAIDPINHGAMLAATKTPVHLIEIVGDDNQPGDLVLPNRVKEFALSGTEPLISAIGLDAVTKTVTADNGASGAVRFTKGHHSSVIDPSVPEALSGALSTESAMAATVEMQSQVVAHAASQGKVIKVLNGCVINGGSCEE